MQRIIQRTQRGKLVPRPGQGMKDSFELEVNSALREALEIAGKAAQRGLESWNRLNNMVTAGSKGSPGNIS